jgi:hypothetical protein
MLCCRIVGLQARVLK